MSKITNGGCLTRSDMGCFIVVPVWPQWASNTCKMLSKFMDDYFTLTDLKFIEIVVYIAVIRYFRGLLKTLVRHA